VLFRSQSGHISAVGYELYLQMMEQAINELKGAAPDEDWEPEVRLRVPSFIPEGYVPDPGHRLSIYKRLASLKIEDELIDMERELTDRFGTIPDEVKNLLQIIAIKQRMKQIGIERMESSERDFIFSFYPKGTWKPEGLVALVQQNSKDYRFKGEGKLVVSHGREEPELETIQRLLERFDLMLH
jgi:transcription-repair coupling factor (superfamily II helicase)